MIIDRLMERAMKYWLETPEANCAQSTACSILEIYGYPQESKSLWKAYRVYGGGLSWRLACGTITGTVGALSFLADQKGLDKDKITEIVKEFLAIMQSKYGDLNCKDLMQKYYENGDINFDLPGRHEKCTDLVKYSLEISTQLINKYDLK
jgi:C_GCAxxG_C_C family probable redox protein